MKHLFLFGLLLTVACGGVHAKPFYSYDLYGEVTGDAGGVDSLANINMGDEFVIRLNIWADDFGWHKVSFQGFIGSWAFLRQDSAAFYYWGDSAPERFGVFGSSSPLNPPEGSNGSTIHPYDIYLTLFGMEQTGTVTIPEEKRLIRNTGEINLNQFRSGGFHFWFFNQDYDSVYGTEEDLYGSINRIVAVPEPGTLLLSALGFGFLLICRNFVRFWGRLKTVVS